MGLFKKNKSVVEKEVKSEDKDDNEEESPEFFNWRTGLKGMDKKQLLKLLVLSEMENRFEGVLVNEDGDEISEAELVKMAKEV